MSKFKEIYTGWKNLTTGGNEESSKLAEERMKICGRCIHTSEKVYLHCGVCGCYIPAKVRSPESECPLNFWMIIPAREENPGSKL
ncbi:MAG: hypothetical protein NTW49_01380 [Bacteroidia bacterium]|nr:hypothetical protein [Bacteroidia bacterium]